MGFLFYVTGVRFTVVGACGWFCALWCGFSFNDDWWVWSVIFRGNRKEVSCWTLES